MVYPNKLTPLNVAAMKRQHIGSSPQRFLLRTIQPY